MPATLVTITFIEYEGKTKVITRSQFASIESLTSNGHGSSTRICLTT